MAAPRGQHARRRPARLRLWWVAAGVVVVGAGVATAVLLAGSGSSPSSSSPGQVAADAGGHTTPAPTTTVPVSFTVAPADGAVNQPLNAKVSVSATPGRLVSVIVSAAGGAPIAGTVDPAGTAWQSAAPLAPHTTYTVTAQALNQAGQSVQQTSSFSTLTPTAMLHASIMPTEGLTVGIGMPITLKFNHTVTDKAAVQAALHVTMSTPIAGGWHWFSDRELHFRPEVYWPAGEQVTVDATLAGVDAGGGLWADTNSTVHFTVGDAHVSTANVATHQMTVTTNGQVVATYPLSAGRTQYPTMNGVHIAQYRQQDVIMDSSTVGIPRTSPDGYYEHVYWDVNISDGGEFVHAAPWSVGSQGLSNVSHGCINLSVANATTFFNYSRIGDIIQVVGSPRPASLSDHGTMDWTTPWDQWVPAV